MSEFTEAILLKEIKKRNVAKVKEILDSGQVNLVDELEEEEGLDINKFFKKEEPKPLSLACEVNSVEIVKMLLEHGATLRIRSIYHESLLHKACKLREDSSELVKVLIDAGFDVNALTFTGQTPLHYVCYQHKVQVPIAKLLLDAGADVNIQNSDGESLLYLATFSPEDLEYGVQSDLQWLLENPFDTYYDLSPELIQMLLDKGADPECNNGLALWHAINRGYSQIVDMLLQKDPGITMEDNERTVEILRHIAKRDHICDEIPRYPSVPYTDQVDTLLPLQMACDGSISGEPDNLGVILKHGADVHSVDSGGFSCLQHACSSVCDSGIRALLDYGANPVDDGWYPLWKYFARFQYCNCYCFFVSVQLMVLSGFKLDEESAKMFLEAAEDEEEDMDDPCRIHFIKFLKESANQPLPLKDLSRMTIHRCIFPSTDKNIAKLEETIPDSLLKYLKFEELYKFD